MICSWIAYYIFGIEHEEEKRTSEELFVVGLLVSLYILIQMINVFYKLRVYQGISFSDVSAFQKTSYCILNWVSLGISLSLITWIAWNAFQGVALTYYDPIPGLFFAFMLLNSVIKPKTMENLFKCEQTRQIKDIMNRLVTEEAKKQAESITESYHTLDNTIYFIRNVNQIENPSIFFEIIAKTNAVIRFVDDGILINPDYASEIKLYPKTYNQIGKYTKKVEEIRKDLAGIEVTAVTRKYFRDTEWEKSNGFEVLRKRLAQPFEQRVESVKEFLVCQNIHVDVNEIRKLMNKGLEKALFKAIPDIPDFKEALDKFRKLESKIYLTDEEIIKKNELKSIVEFQEKVNRLRLLKVQELKGILSEANRSELIRLENEYERYRKEYFFIIGIKHANDGFYIEESSKLEKELIESEVFEEWEYEKIHEYKLVVDRMVLSGKWKNSDIRNELAKMDWMDGEINGLLYEISKINPSYQNIRKSTAQFIKDIKTFTSHDTEGLCYTLHIKYINNVLQNVFKTNNLSEILNNKEGISSDLRIENYNRLKQIFHEHRHHLITLLNAVKTVANDPEFIPSVDIKTWDHLISIMEIIVFYKVSQLVIVINYLFIYNFRKIYMSLIALKSF